MNAERRKLLDKAREYIGEAVSIIEGVQEEEEDAYYSLPEGIQSSERGEQIQENADTLSEILEELESCCEQMMEM